MANVTLLNQSYIMSNLMCTMWQIQSKLKKISSFLDQLLYSTFCNNMVYDFILLLYFDKGQSHLMCIIQITLRMNVVGGFENKQYSYAQYSCEPINKKQEVSDYCS